MPYPKTTILPTDPPGAALDAFRFWVFRGQTVLFVVRGNDAESEALVSRADNLAGGPTDLRRVIWARVPSQIDPAIPELGGEATLHEAIPTARAFTVSLSHQIRDVMPASEPEPDLGRIFLAYAEAERH